MKTKTTFPSVAAAAAFPVLLVAVHAGAETAVLTNRSFAPGVPQMDSTNYVIDAALDTSGGEVATSANYTFKPGYIGQLYDVTAVSLDATPLTVDEGGTRQLGAVALLDDLTMLLLSAGDVDWTVASGPLTGIDVAGLATGDVVFEDTAATAEGTFSGLGGQLELMVLNTDPDNFGSYAGDGIDDGWQVGFFGLPPNADAEPGKNPDKDPHDNYFEFLTGFDPTDGSDFFRYNIVDRTGTNVTLELSKIIPGTRYSIWRSVDLNQTDTWTPFTDFTTGAEVLDHPVTDTNATGAIEHYRIGVEPE